MEIQGYPEYLIYCDGRVFSKKSNKFLKENDNGQGYKLVQLGRGNSFLIHRLVAIHYLLNDKNKSDVDHINRVRDDNHVLNLRWATHSENEQNKGIHKNKSVSFKWIMRGKTRNTYIYTFQRKNCKRKSSTDLSKLLCYSFFYMLKHPTTLS
tara:strand:- start:184 stop:639 length:456 start_codon:yes stop_codon:yes gene_type:complete